MEHVSAGRLQAAEQVFLWRRTTDPATGAREPLQPYLHTTDEDHRRFSIGCLAIL